MARKKVWTVRKVLTMDADLRDRIKAYLAAHPEHPDELAAIRHLLDIGLRN